MLHYTREVVEALFTTPQCTHTKLLRNLRFYEQLLTAIVENHQLDHENSGQCIEPLDFDGLTNTATLCTFVVSHSLLSSQFH